jgi:hypothetical protein
LYRGANQLKGLTHIVVAYIGFAIIFVGLFSSGLEVPSIFISCATLSALFFTILDFVSFFDKEMNTDLEKKSTLSDRVIQKSINKLIQKRIDVMQICVLLAIFSLMVVPYIPNIEHLLTANTNNKITLISLGLVIIVISFRQLKIEGEHEKELRQIIKEQKSLANEYREWSKNGMEVLQYSRDEYEKLLKHSKELSEKLEKLS